MCGLVGYSGHNNAAPLIIEALKRLEYRGYDSAGIATLFNGNILYKKDTGIIEDVDKKQHFSDLPGNTGIGHVRWATHGEVSQTNAHPHTDSENLIAVVHNGIIDNALELKQKLETDFRFRSTTDTEIIPILLAKYYGQTGSMHKAIVAVIKDLHGPFAFLALCKTQQNSFFACASDMPLLLGKELSGCMASSDIETFPEGYEQIYSLENGEFARITDNSILIMDTEGNTVDKKTEYKPRHMSMILNDDIKHFMLREIREEPRAVEQASLQDEAMLNKTATAIRSARNVIFTACGTSRHAALMGRYLFSKVAGRMSEVIIGSEFKYFIDSISGDSVVIAVSQSGETADVLEGVKAARQKGAKIISLINRNSSQLSRLSDFILPLKCGQEFAVAATKSYMAQIAVLTTLSFCLIEQHLFVTQKLKNVAPLVEFAYEANLKKAEHIAKYIADFNTCYFIARGSNFHIAVEAALKMKEVSYVHGEGMPAGELKHGTLALIEKGTPVAVICPCDHTFEDTIHNAEEAKTRGAFIIGVSDRYHPVFDEWLKIPEVDELLYPFVTIVPLQELAYFTALAKNINPDRPRNLAKSVTVR